MRSTKKAALILAAGAPAAAFLVSGPRLAQAAPTAPPVPAEPGTTSASYGDWVMRCQRGGSAEKPVRVCEVAQSMQVQGQTQPIAQIAVGRVGAGQPLQITILLPPNVAFPSSVRVLMDDKDAAGVELAWRRCLPGVCVADAALKEEPLRRWRGAAGSGRIAFKNAGGQEITIPLSFRGLAQALDALTREPG
ncbi:MAG TPA: invasion associated locus B family protein [Methylobacterium sp.]|jgi:invasion protein IalB|uniref:invasion associated locus B family protein n=1 Tax=Methylorubrum sp. B1-46 TaxID=2897334 RepID=UPI001E49DDE2|nr:invasion associated locus B family protein [Methylorubrum sp. B1-46]UGB27553.1 invasion associated locus B family protein [Methylorubrum sp. B1-46]HEV2542596.1 invasion associated locus B family protein [Methylobacterium sp.]